MRAGAIAALLPLLLAGCTVWPPAGTGGWAEHSPAPAEPERLAAAQARFAELAEGPAGQRHPAAVVEARNLLVRALRSQAAGLEPAAGEDLQALERALAGLAAAGSRPTELAAAEPGE